MLKSSNFPNHTKDFVHIWYDDRYRPKVLFSNTPLPMPMASKSFILKCFKSSYFPNHMIDLVQSLIMTNLWLQMTKPWHKKFYQELKCHNISSYRIWVRHVLPWHSISPHFQASYAVCWQLLFWWLLCWTGAESAQGVKTTVCCY